MTQKSQKIILRSMGDAHLHTNWTDGEDSIEEMIKRACDLNLKWILFSEHNRRDSEYSYKSFYDDIKNIQKKYPQIKLFCGAECKILNNNGNIDINSEASKFAEIITGVVHRFPNEVGNIMKPSNKTFSQKDKNNALIMEKELSIAGINAGEFSILGHPLGMTIRRFGLKPDISHFIDLISECKKIILFLN